MDIQISIIVPVYNASRYLEETIKSILNQSFVRFEVILIDDGSSDNSYEIMKKYSEIDNRIVLISQQNSGVSRTRNKGIDLAKGRYICFVDADDIIETNFLKELFAMSFNFDTDISITGYEVFYENPPKNSNLFMKDWNHANKNLVTIYENDLFSYLLNIGLGVNIWNKLFNRAFLKRNHIYFSENQTFDEDMFFVWKCTLVSEKIYLDNQCRYFYRQSNSSSIMSYHENIFNQYEIGFEDLRQFAKKNNKYFEALQEDIDKVYISKIPVITSMIIKAPFTLRQKREKIENYFTDSRLINKATDKHTSNNKNTFIRLAVNKKFRLLIVYGYVVFYKMKAARILKKYFK